VQTVVKETANETEKKIRDFSEKTMKNERKNNL